MSAEHGEEGRLLGDLRRLSAEGRGAFAGDGAQDPDAPPLANYRILRRIGEGGMGIVYEAEQATPRRRVALKVLRPSIASTRALRRFEVEAQAASTLNHPNIVAIHDIGSHEGAPYVVQELLEGETLRERLDEGALPTRKALDYALRRGAADPIARLIRAIGPPAD